MLEISKLLEFARQHPEAVVFVSSQGHNLNNVLRLMGREHAPNARRLGELAPARGEPAPLPADRPYFAAFHPNWPETRGKAGQLLKGDSAHCLSPVAESVGTPNATERAVSALLVAVRSVLPPALEQSVSFTDDVLHPQPVRFYALDGACLRQGGTRLAGLHP